MENQSSNNSAHRGLEDWLTILKSKWIALLALAAWAGSLYVGFIGTPPPDNQGKPADLITVARIVIAVSFVLWGSLALTLARNSHLWFWRVLLVVALLLTIVGWAGYRWNKWVCEVEDKSYVIGSNYSDLANNYIKTQREKGRKDEITCSELIRASVYHPENIWPRSEIDRHRNILTIVFLSLIPLFVLTLSSAVQILVCHDRPHLSVLFSGDWQNSWSSDKPPDVRVSLTVIDKAPVGQIVLNSLTDVWRTKEITPSNAYFRRRTLHIELTQPSCHYLMKVSADGVHAHLHPKKGACSAWPLTRKAKPPVAESER
jgi:hypothetical protein